LVVKANESIFPRSPIKNSDSRFGIKNVNEKSSHPVCWSVKVSSKNRHEQQQTEGNLQPKQRGKPLFSHLINTEVEVKALVADHQETTRVQLCELFAIKTENWVSRTTMCRCVQKLGVHRKKKPGTVAKPRQKESKN
jgi:transposase